MAREMPDYRSTLEQLNAQFPGRELLTLSELMEITGYKNGIATPIFVNGEWAN